MGQAVNFSDQKCCPVRIFFPVFEGKHSGRRPIAVSQAIEVAQAARYVARQPRRVSCADDLVSPGQRHKYRIDEGFGTPDVRHHRPHTGDDLTIVIAVDFANVREEDFEVFAEHRAGFIPRLSNPIDVGGGNAAQNIGL